jgi:alkylation response protein AidB-like acyl-CoA dehydrogenase
VFWSEEELEYRASLRRFVDLELFPHRHELEHGTHPPYEHIRRYYQAFGVGEAALERFDRSLGGVARPEPKASAETLLPMIELSRCSPGLVTAMGVSVGLTAGTILRSGTAEQKRRWVPKLLTFEHVGAWAITEPDSGSDAFGSMRATARAVDGGWLLNGSKTFITNGPWADIIVFICRLDDGTPIRERPVLTFVLDAFMPGLEQSAPMRKMGLHSSPTGEIFVNDVFVGPDRLLGSVVPKSTSVSSESKGRARSAFATERASVACMALGIIERSVELSVEYAKSRVQFGHPIGDLRAPCSDTRPWSIAGAGRRWLRHRR